MRERVKDHKSGQLSTLWTAMDNENFTKDQSRKTVHFQKEKIEHLLIKRNSNHLSQATEPRKYSETFQLYLESLKINDISQINVIKPTLSIEEFII